MTLDESRARFLEAVKSARNYDPDPARRMIRGVRRKHGPEAAAIADRELVNFCSCGIEPKWK